MFMDEYQTAARRTAQGNSLDHFVMVPRASLTPRPGRKPVTDGESKMFMNEYQTAARKTAMGNSLDHFVMGLTEEVGEVAGVMKRFHRGDTMYLVPRKLGEVWKPSKHLSDFAKDKLKAKIGDVLWYIAVIADELETPLEEIAFNNIAKLKDRQARDVTTGSGDNR